MWLLLSRGNKAGWFWRRGRRIVLLLGSVCSRDLIRCLLPLGICPRHRAIDAWVVSSSSLLWLAPLLIRL